MVLDQLKNLRRGRSLAASVPDIRKLLPLFAPASFFAAGTWPGPFETLTASGVGLTWALDLDGGGVRYLDRPVCTQWEEEKVDWRAAALANLRAATTDVFTHRLGRKGGDGIFAGASMHPDGWGSSRLLLREALEEAFPEGYRVAIPEMSCGVAISLRLDHEEEALVKDIVAKCFKRGTRPLALGIFEAQEILPKGMQTCPGS
jgi:hypothetical protein